jgi:hypothetical protein
MTRVEQPASPGASTTAPTPAPHPRRFWRRAVATLARHPGLWPTALAQAHRLAPPRWWRRAPFLPLPDRDYVRFRLETQYGAGEPAPEDLVVYLRWCRDRG